MLIRRDSISWAGRVALVTGASSGIGLAVTKALVARDVRVAMVARSRERLDEVASTLGLSRSVAFPLDVSDRSALTRLPERVFTHFGRLDFDEAAYSASKAGLRAFARALSSELRERRITVSTICPGPVDTGFLGDARDIPALVFSQPMSTAERVARAVLASIESGQIEIDVPNLSGKLATLGYLSPAFLAALRPLLQLRGSRNKQRFIARQLRQPKD